MMTTTMEQEEELKGVSVMEKSEIFCANCKQKLNSEDYFTQTEKVNYELNPVFEIHLNLEVPQEQECGGDEGVIFLTTQTSKTIKVKDALYSVYKLLYLDMFTSTTCVFEDNNFLDIVDEPVGVCTQCARVLTHLYKFYDEFNELREMDSYLSKNLKKLDEYISRHAKEQTSQSDVVKCENDEVADIGVYDESEDDNEVEVFDNVMKFHNSRRGRPRKKFKKHTTTTTTNKRTSSNDESSQNHQETMKANTAADTVNSSSDVLGPGPWIRISRLRPEEIPELLADAIAKEDVHKEFLTHNDGYGADFNSDNATIYSSTRSKRKRCLPVPKRKRKARKRYDSDDAFCLGDDVFSRRKRKPIVSAKKGRKKSSTGGIKGRANNGRISCPFCPKLFLRVYEMNRHLVKHKKERGEAIFSCQKCRRTFLNESDLTKHMRRHERSNYPFGTRRRKLKPEELQQQQEEMEKQAKDSSGARSTFDDDDDDNFFNDLSSTKSDESSDKSRSISQEKPICHICNVPFKRKYDLKRHLERHEGDNLFSCPDCPKTFVTKDEIDRHSLKHVGGKPYKCKFPFCKKAFSDSYKVKSHMKMSHPDSRPFICETCGKTFPFIARLRRHQLLHTGVKPHLCQHCGKTFAILGDMIQHAVIHTGEKPFTCEMCPATFPRKAHLRRHSLIHTKLKTHLCPTCGFTCSLSTTLKRHFQTHTGEKPYKCHCGVAFPDKRPLVRHKMLAHPESNQNPNTSEGETLIIESVVIGTPEEWLEANRNLVFAENPANDFQQ